MRPGNLRQSVQLQNHFSNLYAIFQLTLFNNYLSRDPPDTNESIAIVLVSRRR